MLVRINWFKVKSRIDALAPLPSPRSATPMQCNATTEQPFPLKRVIINISIVILWRNSHFASGRTTNKKLRFSWRWKAGPDQGGKPEVPDLQTSLPPHSAVVLHNIQVCTRPTTGPQWIAVYIHNCAGPIWTLGGCVTDCADRWNILC